MKKCTGCGKEMPDDAIVCSNCGRADNNYAKVAMNQAKPANDQVKPTNDQVKPVNSPAKPVSEPVKPANDPVRPAQVVADCSGLINTLAQRVNTNGIIWLVIGILQVIGGLAINWTWLIVGVLNIISSVQDMNYSKALPTNPKGIVAKFEPLTGPIIVLVYNLVIGGIIGVVGSIYYFVSIRNYVMENKQAFASLDQ